MTQQMKGNARKKFIAGQLKKVLAWSGGDVVDHAQEVLDTVTYECQGNAPLDTDVDLNKKEQAAVRRAILQEFARLVRKALKKGRK